MFSGNVQDEVGREFLAEVGDEPDAKECIRICVDSRENISGNENNQAKMSPL